MRQSTTSESQLDWLVSIDGVHPRRQQHKHKHKHKHSKHAPISVPKAKKTAAAAGEHPPPPLAAKAAIPKPKGQKRMVKYRRSSSTEASSIGQSTGMSTGDDQLSSEGDTSKISRSTNNVHK